MWFIKKTQFFYLARIDINYLFNHGVIMPTTEKALILPEKPKTLRKVKTKFISEIILSTQGGNNYGKEKG
jgi:hypothetical protein